MKRKETRGGKNWVKENEKKIQKTRMKQTQARQTEQNQLEGMSGKEERKCQKKRTEPFKTGKEK